MFKENLFLFLFGLFVILCIAKYAYADNRSYVWTYEYMTMPKGTWESEYYFTYCAES